MTAAGSDASVRVGSRAQPQERDLRWDGRAIRVTTPAPTQMWRQVAQADPSTMPFHTPAWRDCVCSPGSGWQDASRLYELPGGRSLVLMMARRVGLPPGLAVERSWPAGWGRGGLLAPGGARPDEVALVCSDLARGTALSRSVRPGFGAAPAWSGMGRHAFAIPRPVHVAHFAGDRFEDFWYRSVTAKRRGTIRAARRHLRDAGGMITSGNSPDLLEAFYHVYLRWIEARAEQRMLPGSFARWQGRRLEPLTKFAAVTSRLGADCRIWVAWWDGRPIGATMSVYGGDAAVGWRNFTDRSVPGRFRLFELLAVEAIRHACESGRRYIEMGESVMSADLAGIKARLGGQEHHCAEYCFERLPLSRGQVGFTKLRREVEERMRGWAELRRTQDGPR